MYYSRCFGFTQDLLSILNFSAYLRANVVREIFARANVSGSNISIKVDPKYKNGGSNGVL